MNAPNALLQDLIGQGSTETLPAATIRKRAYAWARVSTDMQQERGLSIPEQLREIRRYAEDHGIEIAGEFSEAASAFQKEEKRVEFHRMLGQVKSDPTVTIILVHDFSRFSRDSLRAKGLVRELRTAGIRVVSLNDPEVDPESVAGVYMEAITFAKNEAYSREIAFHTRKGCRANVQTRDPETGWCYKNGGQPLWGYRSQQLVRGKERSGRPIHKSIWVLDDSLVAGKPVHEWTKQCLQMAADGASLDELRDFCNNHDIPARRNRYWSTSTWNSLLEPSVLLKYCGFEVWNVHRKNGTKRSPSEWVTVENAHPALVTPDLARAIVAARRRQRSKRFDTGFHRSRTSSYLLSGGLFKCGRCGSNMTGRDNGQGRYYVCGSQPYRRGKGCGPGVFVPQERLEAAVLGHIRDLLCVCSDPKELVGKINAELRMIWEAGAGQDRNAGQRIEAIELKIANVRRAIEDGLADTAWANARLRELMAEKDALAAASAPIGSPPRIDTEKALSYLRHLDKIAMEGTPAECKKLIREFVLGMQLAPNRLEVDVTFTIPEPVVHQVVAGVGFEPTTG